jgi:hypothetical protein
MGHTQSRAKPVDRQNKFFKAPDRKEAKIFSQYHVGTISNPKVSELDDLTIENANRFKLFTEPDHNYAGMLGDTYKTTNPRRLMTAYQNGDYENGELKPAHVLDAIYACRLNDDKGSVIVVADGCAGHHDDELQDEAIAYLAGYAAKRTGQAMRQFASNNEAYIHLTMVIKTVIDYMQTGFRQKKEGKFAPFISEKTTLACARVELHDDDNIDITGFNIGDTMIVGWNPKTHQFVTLSPARTIVDGRMKYPACIPNELHEGEMQVFQTKLSKDLIIFGLTDFVISHLPTNEPKNQIYGQRVYEDVELNPEKMAAILKDIDPSEPVETFINAIVSACIESSKQAITDKFANSGSGKDIRHTDGDDVGVVAYRNGPR